MDVSKGELFRVTTEDMRVYTDGDEVFLPSVTSVLSEASTPIGIKIWKENNDDWEEIMQFKANRGTLIHYNLLNEFVDGDMYGEEEEDSTEELKLEGNWSRYEEGLEFARGAWEEVKEIRGINDDSVLDVECFVTNIAVGYAGQFDLLYIDESGDLVLSDLKTGKGVYPKYQRQLVAYANALELDIDKLEVIRISPDNEEWEISHSSDWSNSRRELWATFMELRLGMGDIEEDLREIVDSE